jgi:hypothetical protein
VVPTLQLLRGEIQSKIERPVLSHPYEQEKGDDAPFPENLERGGRNARRNAMGYEADMTDVHRSLGNTRWATIVGLHTDKVEQPPIIHGYLKSLLSMLWTSMRTNQAQGH